jgi:hypothetical protein
VEGDWTSTSHWSGYGADDPGSWAVGLYRVDIYFEGLGIDGQLIASEQFEISGEGETDLTANAGPDQTVSGSSPIAVQLDGSGSTGDIVRYQWYNQWGLLRAEGVTPVIDVNFGYNDPQPGTARTFILVVEDSQGNIAQDEVTITLGETPEEEETPPPDAQPTITLEPTEGPPGTEVTATSSGWIVGETVIIQFAISRHGDNLAFSEVSQATVGDDGSFTTTFTVPSDAAIGEQKVIAGIAEVSQQTAVFQVTGEPAVTVEGALTLDPDGHEKTTFRPGDGIWYAVIVRNSGPPVDVNFTWQGKHDDPEIGAEIYSFKNTLALGREFYATVYSPATIPSDAVAGTYLNRETVTVGGQEFVRESRFEVVGKEEPSCPTPAVTVSPGAGEVGDEITVQGKDWLPGGTVTITFTGVIEGYVVGSVPVPGSGEWESSFTVPDEPAGDFDYDLVFSENHEGCELRITQAFVIIVGQETPTPTPTPVPPPTATPTPAPTPSPSPQPTQPPVITLNGANPLHVVQGCPFIDPEATANDPEDGDLTDSIIVEGSVNINAPGQYFLTYTVEDSDRLWAVKTRQVIVFGTISTTPRVFARPEGRAPNLVVIVHGLCTDANDVYLLRRNFGDAINQVLLQDPPPEPWEIVVWDWRKDEETGVDQTPKPPLLVPPVTAADIWESTVILFRQADIAYDAAAGDEGEGNKLANAINQADVNNQFKYKNNQHKYKHIYLIAHSASSKLIDEAAKRLSKLNEKDAERPFIHLTFLDAYTPKKEDREGLALMVLCQVIQTTIQSIMLTVPFPHFLICFTRLTRFCRMPSILI